MKVHVIGSCISLGILSAINSIEGVQVVDETSRVEAGSRNVLFAPEWLRRSRDDRQREKAEKRKAQKKPARGGGRP